MSSLKARYQQLVGDKFFLENDPVLLQKYLQQQQWLSKDNTIKFIEKPGEGNMNLVYRIVLSNGGSFIIKQARPWVEKYPQLDAPVERIEVEYKFYKQQHNYEGLSSYSPKVLGFDSENNVLVMEDLGEATDFSLVYKRDQGFEPTHIDAITNYLNNLSLVQSPKDYPSNTTLRNLNHQHIFYLPFIEDNEFNLDDIQPGLQALASLCKNDQVLKDKVNQLGNIYLAQGKALLHGDFYPGSLLNTSKGLKVIDPEFSFLGPTEWDIAVFIAHLYLAQTSEYLIKYTLDHLPYTAKINKSLFAGFVGTEVLRRLVGLAQLPLEMDLPTKAQLISQAINWIKEGNMKS